MSFLDTADYYQARERQERPQASAVPYPAAATHRTLAVRYRQLAWEAVSVQLSARRQRH